MRKIPNITRQGGFTLIELLVVIAIIALLSSVVLVAAQSARARGRDGKRIGDISQLAKALELYFNDNFGYPTAINVNSVYSSTGVLLSNATTTVQGLVPKYMKQLPAAPQPADGDCGNTSGGYPALNNNYWYESDNKPAQATIYTITFCIGVGQAGASLPPGAHYLANGALH